MTSLQQHKWLSVITSIFLVFGVIFYTGVIPSYAADTNVSEQKVEDTSLTDAGSIQNIKNNISYGPIDFEAYMTEALKLAAPDSTTTGKEINIEQDTRDSRRLNSLLASNWLITRMVLFGISNIDSAAEKLAQGTHITQTYDALVPTAEETLMGTKYSGIDQYSEAIATRNTLAAEKEMLEKNKEAAALIKELSGKSGIQAGDTIYDRVSMIGIFLLACTFMLRLVGVMWRVFIGANRETESPMQMLLECVIKFIVFLAIIHFLKWGIVGLMMFSELVKNVIISATGTNGGSGELMANLQTLISAKNKLVAGAEPSVFQMLRDFSKWIAYVVCYIFYLITSAIITVMIVLGDVMMGVSAALGPLMVALAMVKGFEGWMDNFIRNIVQYALYMPIAAIYSVTMVMIFALVPDIGLITYIAISWAFFLGAIYIPNLAEAMSGSALAALAVGFVGKITTAALTASKMPIASLMKKIGGK